MDFSEFKYYLIQNKITIKDVKEIQYYLNSFTVKKYSLIKQLSKEQLNQLKSELIQG